MNGYDSWLWRLFYCYKGYRWYWIQDLSGWTYLPAHWEPPGPVRGVLMHKRLHDFLCCEGAAADLDASYQLPSCRVVALDRMAALEQRMLKANFLLTTAALASVPMVVVLFLVLVTS